MKRRTLYLAEITVCLALTLSACGKSPGTGPASPETDDQQTIDAHQAGGEHAAPTPAPSPSSSPAPVDPSGEPVFNKTYLGKSVSLIFPHSNNWGYINIHGKDAEALYRAMAIRTHAVEGNLVWLPAEVRQGYSIACYRQSRRQTPDVVEFGCSLYLEYRAGRITRQAGSIDFIKKTKPAKEGYLGEILSYSPDDPATVAVMRFSGADARALYSALNTDKVPYVERQSGKPAAQGFEKQGESYACTELEHSRYACSIFLNYQNGAIVQRSP